MHLTMFIILQWITYIIGNKQKHNVWVQRVLMGALQVKTEV